MKKMDLTAVEKRDVIKLYHGSASDSVKPTFGLGDDSHDYGKGFYLTPDIELAKEWAVSSSHGRDGWVYGFELDLAGLSVFNFDTAGKMSHLIWITEIAKHRALNMDVETGRYYDVYRDYLNDTFGFDTNEYDVLVGWRADDAYVSIIDAFMASTLSVPSLRDALLLGDLGIQYCCRTERAFSHLHVTSATSEAKSRVPFDEYYKKYSSRVHQAKQQFYALLNGPVNRSRDSIRLLDLWRNAQ